MELPLEDQKRTANHISSTDIVILAPKAAGSSFSLLVGFSIQEETVGVARTKSQVAILHIDERRMGLMQVRVRFTPTEIYVAVQRICTWADDVSATVRAWRCNQLDASG